MSDRRTHWIQVIVHVPIQTTHPSPVKAENDAFRKVEQALAGTDMRVGAASYSRSEPSR